MVIIFCVFDKISSYLKNHGKVGRGKLIKLTENTECTQRKRIVESKHMWFILVLTHVVSCREPFNELN